MLVVEGLKLSLNGRPILKGVNLRLGGGMGCLLGPNGAGKTTLIKCIVGALKPDEGRVLLNGIDLTSLDPMSRARLVSYVPQELTVSFPYSVLEIVIMGRNPHLNLLIGPSREDEEVALAALRALGVEDLASRPFTTLSGGEKRLVMIARALAQGGRLMIFDEPTSFLDFRNKVMTLSIIRRLSREGRLVLVSLHDPNLACLFCDKVFIMSDGIITAQGSPEDIVAEDIIERVYGLKVKVVRIENLKVIVPRREAINALTP